MPESKICFKKEWCNNVFHIHNVLNATGNYQMKDCLPCPFLFP